MKFPVIFLNFIKNLKNKKQSIDTEILSQIKKHKYNILCNVRKKAAAQATALIIILEITKKVIVKSLITEL